MIGTVYQNYIIFSMDFQKIKYQYFMRKINFTLLFYCISCICIYAQSGSKYYDNAYQNIAEMLEGTQKNKL